MNIDEVRFKLEQGKYLPTAEKPVKPEWETFKNTLYPEVMFGSAFMMAMDQYDDDMLAYEDVVAGKFDDFVHDICDAYQSTLKINYEGMNIARRIVDSFDPCFTNPSAEVDPDYRIRFIFQGMTNAICMVLSTRYSTV